MSTLPHTHQASYYFVTVSSATNAKLLATNNERAFVVAQLQDLLTVRSCLEEPFNRLALAYQIDLLAYSLMPYSMQFVLFAIAPSSVTALVSLITERLTAYQSDQAINRSSLIQPIIQTETLYGPHEALQTTVSLHLSHPNWEYDRYSSIGFYLHDRRGAWMRLWRLAHLYDNEPKHYLQLILAQPVP